MTSRNAPMIMKSIKLLLFLAISINFSCESDNSLGKRNPYLLDISFNISLNTNLPQYSTLQFPGNALYISNVGNKGLFVINTGSGIRAWDASDPNHEPRSCSQMQLNGIEVTCSCEDYTYNLYTGLVKNEDLNYSMLEYQASMNGNYITISN